MDVAIDLTFDCNWSIFKREQNTEAIKLSDITDKNKRNSPNNRKKNKKKIQNLKCCDDGKLD